MMMMSRALREKLPRKGVLGQEKRKKKTLRTGKKAPAAGATKRACFRIRDLLTTKRGRIHVSTNLLTKEGRNRRYNSTYRISAKKGYLPALLEENEAKMTGDHVL